MELKAQLYLVPTPIGNLEDITFRAIKVLGLVDKILTEDTRTSGKLLQHLGITKPLQSFHAHNEHGVLAKLIQELKAGNRFAMISDAGTPGISDPGFLLVREAIAQGIPIESLPGPTALIPALVQSGFPTERFIFEGFLPVKKGRQSRIQSWISEDKTIVFYESPHRIEKLLTQLVEILGPEREISVSRELTKLFEETIRGTAAQLLAHFSAKEPKGEFVVVIKGVEER